MSLIKIGIKKSENCLVGLKMEIMSLIIENIQVLMKSKIIDLPEALDVMLSTREDDEDIIELTGLMDDYYINIKLPLRGETTENALVRLNELLTQVVKQTSNAFVLTVIKKLF